jgi:serine/threonine protein kinase
VDASDDAEDLTASIGELLLPIDVAERSFGRFTLRYEIASGGMATVYLARARGPGGFDRPLALKRIHPHLAKKREYAEMFLDEARLAARITHPNVCSVFDFGQVDGTYFMAMEYLVGQPLSSLLRAGARRPELVTSPRWQALAAKIIADACEGLHAAHELKNEAGKPMGVVHRDVSPHNIFVTYDGAVKVVDFGVAKAEGRLQQTTPGALKGKFAYMSPEQIRGKDIDRRLDVWALGVCLWELLAAKRLFGKRSEGEMLQAVVHEELAPPSRAREGVPDALDRIVMRALERDVEKRYPTARALGRDLNAFVASSGVSASLPDLAELMDELFQAERERKLDVVASVLEASAEPVPGGTQSGARLLGHSAATAILDGPTEISESGRAGPPVHPAKPAAGRRPLDPMVAVVMVVAILAAVLIVALVTRMAEAPRTEHVVALAPMPSSSPIHEAPIATVPEAPTVTAPEAPTAIAPEAPSDALPEVVAPPVAPVVVAPPAPVEVAHPSTPIEVAPPSTPVEVREPAPRSSTTSTPRPRPSTEPEAVPRGGGTVNVGAHGGWAEIYVDGSLVGRTPRSIRLPAGRHVLELRPSGQLPARRVPVTVRAGETERVSVDLE